MKGVKLTKTPHFFVPVSVPDVPRALGNPAGPSGSGTLTDGVPAVRRSAPGKAFPKDTKGRRGTPYRRCAKTVA